MIQARSAAGRPSVLFFWDNFGPVHADRVTAVGAWFSATHRVVGVELFSQSVTYSWAPTRSGFERITIFGGDEKPGVFRRLFKMLSAFRTVGRGHYFLCHYERPEVFVSALVLRVSGSRVYAMIDSKFDDKPRRLGRELVKFIALLPYQGALAGSPRTADYLRFLGMGKRRITGDYDTLSISRIRADSGLEPAPGGVPHADRDFVSVARLVPKKNLATLVRAYAEYRAMALSPRDLHLCGDGPEQGAIESLAEDLGVGVHVHFQGFLQTADIAKRLGKSLALLLPSTEEQFGQVILEAQAMGLPVIVSDNCGARDVHVRTGVNGYVVEPDNISGMAHFMASLSDDPLLWNRMAVAASAAAPAGDVQRFVESVERQLRK